MGHVSQSRLATRASEMSGGGWRLVSVIKVQVENVPHWEIMSGEGVKKRELMLQIMLLVGAVIEIQEVVCTMLF